MFSEMIEALHNNRAPRTGMLAKRYDFALTKKLGIVKLAPAFWMQDPKINPRSDHLLWAALLLKDRERIDMALSVMAVEQAETASSKGDNRRQGADSRVRELIEELLEQFPDKTVRQQFATELVELIPEVVIGEKA